MKGRNYKQVTSNGRVAVRIPSKSYLKCTGACLRTRCKCVHMNEGKLPIMCAVRFAVMHLHTRTVL